VVNSDWHYFFALSLQLLQLDAFNRTLMEFADRRSDFGPPVPSQGIWVNSNCIQFELVFQYSTSNIWHHRYNTNQWNWAVDCILLLYSTY